MNRHNENIAVFFTKADDTQGVHLAGACLSYEDAIIQARQLNPDGFDFYIEKYEGELKSFKNEFLPNYEK